MKQTFLVLASALLLAACAHDGGNSRSASDTGDELQSNVTAINGEAA